MKPSPRRHRNDAILCIDADYDSDNSSARSTTRRISSMKPIQVRRTIKERHLRSSKVFNGGTWTKEERLEFLRGLRKFGPGQWRKIQTVLTTRSNIQIKSHGQKILKRMKVGENIYQELEEEEASLKASPPPSTTSVPADASEAESMDFSVSSGNVKALDSTPKTSPMDFEIPPRSGPLKKRHKWHSQQAIKKQKCNSVLSDASNRAPDGVKSYNIERVNSSSTKQPEATDHTNGPKSSRIPKRSEPSLSIKEATVVLALVELADPVVVQAKIATL